MDTKKISVEKIVNRGSGMGYDENNKVVFIPFTVDGDVIETKIVTNKKSFEIGEIAQIITKSEKRIEAKCEHYGICGGCSYQHIGYDYELDVKKRQSDETFNCDLGEIFHGEEYGYRNKVTFHASYKSGSLKLGFMMAKSNRQIDVNKCLLIPDFVNNVKALIERVNLAGLEQVVIKIDQIKRNLLVNFVGKDKKELYAKTLKKYRDEFAAIVNDDGEKIQINKFINSEKIDKASFEVTLNNVSYRISTDDFFQVNYNVASMVYKDIVTEVTSDEAIKTVIDGFCGSMSIGLQFRNVPLDRVFGIELNESSVKQAKDNISLNKAKNYKVLKGDFNKLIKGLEIDFSASVLILDPPRDGVGIETMQFINSLGFKKVVYMSCDQMTLKRDITHLRDYSLSFSKIYDMFPRTFHVETLLIFDRD